MDKPKFFIVGLRPVKQIPAEGGGFDIQAFSWETGEFERAIEYLTRIMHGDYEVEEVTKQEFDRTVDHLRKQLKNKKKLD